MATLDLSKYGIKDVKEVLHNPSYDDWCLHRSFS